MQDVLQQLHCNQNFCDSISTGGNLMPNPNKLVLSDKNYTVYDYMCRINFVGLFTRPDKFT